MSTDNSPRRLPLRTLVASSDKVTRQLLDQVRIDFLKHVSEVRDLSRPVRRRSHYPQMSALQVGLQQLDESAEHLHAVTSSLLEHLDALRDLGQREKLNRRL